MSTLIIPAPPRATHAPGAIPPGSMALCACVYADSEAVLELLCDWLDEHCATIRTYRTWTSSDGRFAAGNSPDNTLFFLAAGDEFLLMKRARGTGGCLNCLQTRRLAFKSYAEIMAAKEGRPFDVPALALYSEFAREVIGNLIAALGDKVLDDFSHGFCLRLRTLQVIPFVLSRSSGCAVCGQTDDGISPENEFWTNPRPKLREDRYRIKRLSEISFDVKEIVNPVCGMLGVGFRSNRFGAFHAETTGAYIDPNALRVPVMWTGHKTRFDDSLKVGVLEGLERHAGLYPRTRPAITTTFAEIRDRALDPRECGLYEDAAYAADKALKKFSEDLPLQWVWGYSLTQRREILVPSQLAYYGDPDIILGNSSGCATGTCLEEAVFYALMELIERDAFLLHWFSKLSPRRIAVDSLRSLEAQCMVERARRAGFEVHLLDTRLDLPVPSALAILTRNDNDLGTFSLSASASFSPEEALESALCEVATHVHWFKGRVLAAQQKKDLRLAVSDFSVVENMEEHSLLYGYPEAKPLADFLLASTEERSFEETYRDWLAMRPASRYLRDDVEFCAQLFNQAGMNQVIVVNQTSPEESRMGVHTVRAIVPGLLPLDFGFGHCRAAQLPRTYSVPFKMGRRPRPLTPPELYRAPHPFP